MQRKLQLKLSVLALVAVTVLLAFTQTVKQEKKAVPCTKCCMKQEGCKPETPKDADYIFYESLNGHMISAVYE